MDGKHSDSDICFKPIISRNAKTSYPFVAVADAMNTGLPFRPWCLPGMITNSLRTLAAWLWFTEQIGFTDFPSLQGGLFVPNLISMLRPVNEAWKAAQNMLVVNYWNAAWRCGLVAVVVLVIVLVVIVVAVVMVSLLPLQYLHFCHSTCCRESCCWCDLGSWTQRFEGWCVNLLLGSRLQVSEQWTWPVLPGILICGKQHIW